MSQERWDVALKVLTGPLASMGEQVYRGPVVRIGAKPGPGGFQLNGYRGLDARHAVVTAYDGGTASIAPVGRNQVRMAPHPHVEWEDIDPMSGPEYLSEGCAVHLGPVGRGATLEFVECRRLGVWAGGGLQSAVDVTSPGTPVVVGPGAAATSPNAPPVSIDARSVRSVRSSSVPIWFVGCLLMMAMSTAVGVLTIVIVTRVDVEKLGPVDEGQDRYDFADLDSVELNPQLLEGLNQPFNDFVMQPNVEASGRRDLKGPDSWDARYLELVTASVQQHVSGWSFFRRLDAVRDSYALVVETLRDEGLPEVWAAIPYQESLYDGTQQSFACAKGFWQFMPEVAHRVDRDAPFGFKVQECTLAGASGVTWTPERFSPIPGVMKNAEYIDRDNPSCSTARPEARCCRIQGCKIDHRENLEKSTKAALFTLGEAYRDPTIAASGAAVQLAILSHNAGYDDGRFGRRKRSNVLPAFEAWSQGKSADEVQRFYGTNVLTSTPHTKEWAGSALPPETQHYAYPITAQHFLAVCYYGQSYADEIRAFQGWKSYTEDDGYCKGLEVPRAEDVRKRKKK